MTRKQRIAAVIGGVFVLAFAYLVLEYAPFMATVRTPFDSRPAAAGDIGAVRVGDRYLDFTAKDSNGNAFTLSSLDGKPVLLKFFRAHW